MHLQKELGRVLIVNPERWLSVASHEGAKQNGARRYSTEQGVAEFCAAKLRSEDIPFPTHASAEGVEVPV